MVAKTNILAWPAFNLCSVCYGNVDRPCPRGPEIPHVDVDAMMALYILFPRVYIRLLRSIAESMLCVFRLAGTSNKNCASCNCHVF